MTQTVTQFNWRLTRGLVTLMQPEKSTYFKHLDQCGEYIRRKAQHPFGLDVPDGDGVFGTEITFVGAWATDITVETFLANIRFWANYTDGQRITKLRVISVPTGEAPGQHYVFFEAWVNSKVLISGETTDHSGAGNLAREELEDVFSILSFAYQIQIERVTVRKPAELLIRELYAG